MKGHQLINQDSGDFEYYTDLKFVEAARSVMGSIDLDPASSKTANKRIKATEFFTEKDDGLTLEWFGNVWMNHPFSRENNPKWIKKLVSEYQSGRTIQFCCITYAATSEAWFRPLMDFPQCYLSPRTNYILPSGELKRGVTKGSVITYGGPANQLFYRVFQGTRNLGRVQVPINSIFYWGLP